MRARSGQPRSALTGRSGRLPAMRALQAVGLRPGRHHEHDRSSWTKLGCLMPRIEFDLTTGVSPDRFMAALTDFSPARADIWPNIDAQHLKVHELGADWADVTEGSSVAGGVWE